MLTRPRLQSLLSKFPSLTIGLLGDLFLDRYLELEPGIEELSIETGLEAYQIGRVRNSPGALGTVLNNLTALGVGKLVPITVIGDDGHGYDLVKELRKLQVDERHILQASDRLTPTYTKPLRTSPSGAWTELNRLDVRTRGPLGDATRQLLRAHLWEASSQVDGLIVLDQVNEEDWGVVGPPVRGWLRELADLRPDLLIFVDSRRHIGSFEAGTLKGNQAEFLAAAEGLGSRVQAGGEPDPRAAEAAAACLAEKTGRPAFCTVGPAGIVVARPGGTPQRVPGREVSGPLDIVGAGDSATAGIVASHLAGANELEAAAIGNLVASITIQQLGTTGTATPSQVLERFVDGDG